MNWYLPAAEWWCLGALAVTVPLLGACSGSVWQSERSTENSLRDFRAAAQRATECRALAARNPRYHILQEHMPLTDIQAATLSQMASQKFATKDEISALGYWTSDLNACLEPLLQKADATIPGIGPILEAWWDDDNVVFVKLVHHQVTWGEVVVRLRSNRTKMRANAIARADRVSEDISKMELAQFNRRTAIVSSVIGILP